MNESDSRPGVGRFGVTARLFHLVDEMPRDKQLILLKQLLGERITSHLCKLIVEMSDDQLQRLCEQLEELPFEDAPVTTINLDEDGAAMRADLPHVLPAQGDLRGRWPHIRKCHHRHQHRRHVHQVATRGLPGGQADPRQLPDSRPRKSPGAERRGPAQRSGRHRRAADQA